MKRRVEICIECCFIKISKAREKIEFLCTKSDEFLLQRDHFESREMAQDCPYRGKIRTCQK